MCIQKIRTDQKLREGVEQELGAPLYDAVWKNLRELRDEYVKGLFGEGEASAFESIVECARDRMELANDIHVEMDIGSEEPLPLRGYMPARERDEADKTDTPEDVAELIEHFYFLNPKSQQMLLATSEYLASVANEHPEVERFRKDYLGGELLISEQATELLSSYAARYLTPEEFSKQGIPIIGHTAEIVETYMDVGTPGSVDHRVAVRVDPPGTTLRLRYAAPNASSTDEGYITRRKVKGGYLAEPHNVPLQTKVEEEMSEAFAEAKRMGTNFGPPLIEHINTEESPTEVWPGSLVDEIYSFSQRLAMTFAWPSRSMQAAPFGLLGSKDDSARFLLTGEAPLTRPVEVRMKGWRVEAPYLKRIELSLSPWVRDEDVIKVYKQAQRILIGPRNRWPDKKTLEIVRSILKYQKLKGDRLTWPKRQDMWNREHPGKRVKDYRKLYTYYQRGCRTIHDLNLQ